MHRTPTHRQIQAKLSTMPPQRSQATAYLNAYKMMLEKERLEQELEKLEARRHQIQQRLAILNSQTIAEEDTTHQQANTNLEDNTPKFKTLTLEY
ncbi:sugar ABC transporter ATP-binding protein [Nostoc sp. FACHB-973]|nr:sugar ABC transporter ATP-binding protein [Nostoc sp. FACHB-973]